MTTTQATEAPAAMWETLPVPVLLAHPGNVIGEADPGLTADVAAHGVTDPIYVTTLGTGAVQVIDGLRRLAAAQAAGLTEVRITHRRLIRVTALTANPANVREDLKITKSYVENLRSEGVRIDLILTRDENGAVVLVDGHRRLAGAVAAGFEFVPVQWQDRTTADQLLDQVSTQQREPLTEVETALALFAADAAGVDLARIAKASGRTQKKAAQMVRAGGAAATRAVTTAAPDYEFSLDQLATLADMEQEAPEAAARVAQEIKKGERSPGFVIERAVLALNQQRREEAARAELEAAGRRVREAAELSEKARPVHELTDVSAEEHEACRGSVWVLDYSDRAKQYTQYCSNVVLYEHTTQAAVSDGPTTAQRRAVKAGNLDWDASEPLRREFLIKIIGRRTWPKETREGMEKIALEAMLSGSRVLAERLGDQKTTRILGQLLGMPDSETRSRSEFIEAAQKNPRRHTGYLFATVAAAYETRMLREAWRTDASADEGRRRVIREQAATWLRWIESLGYEPTPIERAVMDDQPYQAHAEDEPLN